MYERTTKNKNTKKLLALFLILAITFQVLACDGLTSQAQDTKKATGNQAGGEEIGSDPAIDEELIGLRTEYSKTYLQSDGTYLQITCAEPLHQKVNGIYQPIDNRLELVTKGSAKTYQNRRGNYEVLFPENLDKGIEVNYQGQKLTMTLLPEEGEVQGITGSAIEKEVQERSFTYRKPSLHNQKKKVWEEEKAKGKAESDIASLLPDKTTGGIEYTQSDGQSIIRYETATNRLKENIVISSVEGGQDVYTYEIKADGLTAKKKKDGSIHFYQSGEKEPIYTLEAPYLFDSAKESAISYSVKTKFQKMGNAYQITYQPDKKWMEDPARVYPVTLDPTIAFGGGKNGDSRFQEAFIQSSQPTVTGKSGGTVTSAGNEAYLFGADLFNQIGNQTIVRASLGFYNSPGGSTAMVGLKRITSSWNAGTVNWNSRPSKESEWVDYTVSGGCAEFDITSYATQYGRKQSGNYGLWLQWFSGANTTIYNVSQNQAPYLAIEYRPATGKGQPSSHTVDIGRAGSVNIDDDTGYASLVCEDLSIGGNRMPVTIQRVRTVETAMDAGMKGFFQTNYHQQLTYLESQDCYEYRNETGSRLRFNLTYDGETEFEDSQGAGYYLDTGNMRGDGDLASAVITNPTGETLQFDAGGRLITIQGSSQAETAKIQIQYTTTTSSLISKMIDGAGGEYRFTYQSNILQEIGYVEKGGSQVRKKVSYRYETGPSAMVVTYPDGKTAKYVAADVTRFSKIQNIDGSSITLAYDDNYALGDRVTQVQEWGNTGLPGDVLNYTYGATQTAISDGNGNKDTYQFDRSGRVTSVRNRQGEAVFASYGGNQGQLLGISGVRSTGIGESLVSQSSYFSVGYQGSQNATITTGTHDNTIPILAGKTYEKIVSTSDSSVGKVLTLTGGYANGQTLTFGGWVKGNFLMAGSGSLNNRGFWIRLTLHPSDGAPVQSIDCKPNPYVTDWQYILEEVTLEHPCSYLGLEIMGNKQVNPFYISNIECKKQKEGSILNTEEDSIPFPTDANAQSDNYGNVLRESNGYGGTTQYTYDTAGNLLTEVASVGTLSLTRKKTYQDKNLTLSEEESNGTITSYTYDKLNQLEKEQFPNNTVRKQEYNGMGQMTKASLFASSVATTPLQSADYTYDNDRLSKIQSGGQTYSFLYDTFGSMKEIRWGSYPMVTYEYQSNQNRIPTKVTYGNGASISYTYNDKNQLMDDGQGTYSYDSDGELTQVSDRTNSLTTIYEEKKTTVYSGMGTPDPANLVFQYEAKENQTVFRRGSCEAGVTSTTAPTGNTKTTELSYQGVKSAKQITRQDGIGRVAEKQIQRSDNAGNILRQYFTYQSMSSTQTTKQVSNVIEKVGTSETIRRNDTYTYDAMGNITSIQDKGGKKIRYEYDSAGQLTREDRQETNRTCIYVYDGKGNLTKKQEYLYTEGTQFGNLLSEKKYTYSTSDGREQLTAYDGKSITYDDLGNPKQYNDFGLKWSGRKLTQSTALGKGATYRYDTNGLRTRKSGAETIRYHYVDGVLQGMTIDSSKELVFSYDEDGQLLGLWYNGSKYTYETNLQGDIIGILDASGNEVASYTYNAWGKLLSGEPSSEVGKANPLRYRGYVYDTDTEWYYLQSRYYDPETGRFLSADEPGVLLANQGNLLQYNLYMYCAGNPINYADPNGCVAAVLVLAAPYAVQGAIWVGGAFVAWVAGTELSKAKRNYKTVVSPSKIAEAKRAPVVSHYTANAGFSITQYRLPAWQKVKLDMKHIISGHTLGGGRGDKNKDKFPKGMTDAAIAKLIQEAYKNAKKMGPIKTSWEKGVEHVTQQFQGKAQGKMIQFWFDYSINTIRTAWPKWKK